jgi:uncharacterized membrane protein
MHRGLFARWRANFITGLVILLPALITLAVVKWLFGTVAKVTDTLLFFLPRVWTHADDGRGDMHWYWSLAALVMAFFLVALFGLLTRYYVGKRLVEWMDLLMLRVPLLNKIYGTIKQVNEAFSSGTKTAFKTVVLVEFPREGAYAIGFITSEQENELQMRTRERVVCVFLPTTPNPTSGFLILFPESKVTRLNMSVQDAIKYIVSLGSVSPDFGAAVPAAALPPTVPPPTAETVPSAR